VSNFVDKFRRAILLHQANPVDFANFRIADLPIEVYPVAKHILSL
jgi:hypothetical protein